MSRRGVPNREAFFEQGEDGQMRVSEAWFTYLESLKNSVDLADISELSGIDLTSTAAEIGAALDDVYDKTNG